MTVPIVLTVCLGNICRSPTAEAAIRQAADDAHVALEVTSAGTGTWHLGQPPNPPMAAAAAAKSLELTGVAQQVDAHMLADASLVLAMDRSNLADLEDIAAEHGVTTPIVLLRRFDPATTDGDSLDVPDPYGGGADGFNEVVDICLRTAPHVVAAIAAS